MKTIRIGYARVSTSENRQTLGLELQIEALQKIGCNKIFSECLSGTDDSRPGFNHAVSYAKQKRKAGFAVRFYVYKLDRLSRHTIKSIATIDSLSQLEIDFISLREEFDTGTPVGILQYQLLAMFAEYEVNQIRTRTREGLAQAKRDGKILGRPKIRPLVEQEICKYYKNRNYKVETIASKFNVSVTTIYNIAKRNQLSRKNKYTII